MSTRDDGDDDGGPAFPGVGRRIWWNDDGKHREEREGDTPGMTLLDYFAAKALPLAFQGPADDERTLLIRALDAYDIADAMLKARAMQS